MSSLGKENGRAKRPPRDRRQEAVFAEWLRTHAGDRYREPTMSYISFRDLCDAGEVEGFGPEDFQP